MINRCPIWCIIKSLVCSCCRRRTTTNDSEVLCRLPAFMANSYPVDYKYALANKNSHIGTEATTVFDTVMTMYANSNLCSHLLCSSMNNAYLEKLADYYSYHKEKKATSDTTMLKPYIDKNGVFIKTFPPTGETVRELFDDALNNANTPWKIIDHNRHTQEIQAVKCSLTMAQDHTFDVIHNYQKKLGATALWDVATETGEIASAMLVPTTKTIHFAHAAQQLAKRPTFNPKVMYSDTYPNKSGFWPLLFDGIEGRLDLFHYIQRITKTMRKKHIDYNQAMASLLDAVYTYHSGNYEAVISALKKGYVGKRIHSNEDIAELRSSRLF